MTRRRIAFITESSTRQATEMPAYEFFRSPKSRWVNEIIRYCEVRNFPREDIYFLSHYGQRIIPYEQPIGDYPQTETTRSAAKRFAQSIVDFVKQYEPTPFVELHLSRIMTDPLKELFKEHGIRFRIYGESESLAKKPGHYQELIADVENERRLKDIQREGYVILSEIETLTPHVAKEILTKYQHQAQLHGVENIFEEIKGHLKSYGNKLKDSQAAEDEFREMLKKHDHLGEVEQFLLGKDSLPMMFKDMATYERLKARYGKVIAKYKTFLIKRDYALLMENKIAAVLNQLRIALL